MSHNLLSDFSKTFGRENGNKVISIYWKKMVLTQAGELYVKRAKELLIIQNQFLGELSDLVAGYTGRIRIGTHIRRTSFFIPELLVKFEKSYPNIEIICSEISSEEMEKMLLEGELDIIFTNKLVSLDKLNVISIYKDKLLIAISPNNPACKYAVKIKGHEYPWLDLNHVKNNRFIIQDIEQATRTFTNKALAHAKVNPEKFLLSEYGAASQLAAEEYGVAFTMASYVKNIFLTTNQ